MPQPHLFVQAARLRAARAPLPCAFARATSHPSARHPATGSDLAPREEDLDLGQSLNQGIEQAVLIGLTFWGGLGYLIWRSHH